MNDSQKFTNVKESVSSAEWQLRCDLAACYRYAADQKWDDLIFTHFSVRLPGKVNPAGFVLHSAIHSAREDAHCIIHLHTPEGIAVAAQKEGLLPISQTALSVYSDLAYHDYEGIVFDAEEKERLIPNIGGKNCILLRNHGLLATGKTIAEAFLRIYFLQRACEAQVMAQSGGAELIHLSDKVIERVYSQTVAVGDMIASLSWSAVISRVERIGPDYKT